MVKLANKRAAAEFQEEEVKTSKKNGKQAPVPADDTPTEQELLAGRPVVYQELEARVYYKDGPLGPIYAEQMAEWLGWEEAGKSMSWGQATLLTLPNGGAVRCVNNMGNRPFYESWMKQIAQDILMKKFAPKGPNGEAIIIGRTGRTLSAQHRGTALMYAQHVLDTPEGQAKYGHLWPEGKVWIESFVSLGVDESPETIITLDNTKSRTGADCLYTSPHFADLAPAVRRSCCRIVEGAVKVLWERLGIKQSTSALPGKKVIFRRTPSEVLNFLDRHPTLGTCARVILAEDGEQGVLKKYLSLGSCSAALYLMATGASELATYADATPPSEAVLDMGRLPRAQEFFKDFAAHPCLAALRYARRPWRVEADPEGTNDFGAYYFPKDVSDKTAGNWPGTLAEKLGLLAVAWTAYRELDEDAGEELTEEQVQLSYGPGPEYELQAPPGFGGIDLGDSSFREPEQVEATEEAQEAEDDGPVEGKEGEEAEQSPDPTTKKEKPATRKLREKVKARKNGQMSAVTQLIHETQEKHPADVLIWPLTGGKYLSYAESAVYCAMAAGGKSFVDPSCGLEKYMIDGPDYPAVLAKLEEDGFTVLLCHDKQGVVSTEDALSKGVEGQEILHATEPEPEAEEQAAEPPVNKKQGSKPGSRPGAAKKQPLKLKGGVGK